MIFITFLPPDVSRPGNRERNVRIRFRVRRLATSLKSYELLPSGMHAAYACTSLCSSLSFRPSLPLSPPPVSLSLLFCVRSHDSRGSVFNPRRETQEEANAPRASSTRRRLGESHVFSPLSLSLASHLFLRSRGSSHLWISMNSKDNFSTGCHHSPPLLLAFRQHPLSRAFSTPVIRPLRKGRSGREKGRKFHSKRTPLCKYSRESLLMLSWGGQRVTRTVKGWRRARD